MSHVTLANVEKVYPGGITAVAGVSLEIANQEFVVLVGPSGCGKSTTLRMVAGLEEITGGTISIDGRVVNDVAPKDRDIAMVFQNYALYPHMSVRDNMAFSLKLRRRSLGLSRKDIRRKVEETAVLLGIQELLDRKPKALSGGQRQRVAVGRAIVRNPKAFLFDEPLSNLDAKLRVEMRAEIKRLQRRLRTTTIYVTHDQEEAMSLGDRVVVMKDGKIQQCDAPQAVYDRPVNRFVAGFIGSPPMNFLGGRLVRHEGGLAFDEGSGLVTLNGRTDSPAADGKSDDRLECYLDREMVLGIRPEAFTPEPAKGEDGRACPKCSAAMMGRFCHLCGAEWTDGSIRAMMPHLDVQVSLVESMGDEKDVYMTTGSHKNLVGRVDSHARVLEGSAQRMYIDLRRVHLFEPGELGANVMASQARETASAN